MSLLSLLINPMRPCMILIQNWLQTFEQQYYKQHDINNSKPAAAMNKDVRRKKCPDIQISFVSHQVSHAPSSHPLPWLVRVCWVTGSAVRWWPVLAALSPAHTRSPHSLSLALILFRAYHITLFFPLIHVNSADISRRLLCQHKHSQSWTKLLYLSGVSVQSGGADCNASTCCK